MLSSPSPLPKELERFRAAPWESQQTYKTPLKDVERFVSTFLAPYSVQKGAVSTDQVVFEPRNVLELLQGRSVSLEDLYKFALVAEGKEEVAVLLVAVCSRVSARHTTSSAHAPCSPAPYAPAPGWRVLVSP
jgi:hypothetical protein